MPNQLFTTATFAATGAPTLRNTPDRLGADQINAKDFGAVGDGVTDDSTALQAAITQAYTLNTSPSGGCVLFIPRGTYKLNSQLDVCRLAGTGQGCLIIKGAGKDVTILKGANPGAAIVVKSNYGQDSWQGFWDLTIWNTSTAAGSIGFSAPFLSRAPFIVGCHFKAIIGLIMDHEMFGQSVTDCLFTCVDAAPSGSVGYYLNQGDTINCRATGFDIGFAISGNGVRVIGCRIDNCTIGMKIGYGGLAASIGGLELIGNRIENCSSGFYIHSMNGASVISNVFSGTSFIPIDLSGPGSSSQNTLWAANVLGAGATSGYDFYCGSDIGSPGVQIHNVCMAMAGVDGWSPPASGMPTVAGWTFINCGTPGASPPAAYMRYANLPGESGVQEPRQEGQEFTIVNANTQSFGGIVTATGGSNHYKVRWNGSNWIRTG